MTGTADTTTRGTITISHTHQDGTILHGSAKGDGVLELARQHGFTWRKQPGIFIRGSRDRDADRRKIGGLSAALQAAGWTVETDVDNTPRTAADRRASLDERAADRADRLHERSGNAAAESERRRNASNAITDGIPFGQPVQPPGHHSRNAHLNALARSDNHMRKGIEASDKAERLEERARGTEANAAHRNNPRAIMRRIEKLETDRRSYARSLTGYRREFENGAGKVYSVDDYPAATGERAEELRRWDARDAEEIEHLQAELAKLEAAGTFTAWGPEHFVKGDEVRYLGSWHPVRRVNKKSVSVPGGYGMAGNDATWNDTLTWDRVGGRRRGGMQWDTPNGEPWPVELARKVAQWATLAHRAGLPDSRYGTPEHTSARHVGYAQRLVHGLELDASDREIAVIAASITGTDACRDLAARYLAVYFRLQAGELVPAIVATLTPVTGEPAWQLPTGREPEDRRAGPGWPMRDGIELVKVGDLVAGVYDRFRGDGLHRWFCGPVTAVGDVVDRREVGEFVTITIDGDVSHTFNVGRWLAVYPAGTWEQPTTDGSAELEPQPAEADTAPDTIAVEQLRGGERVTGAVVDGSVYALGLCIDGKPATDADPVRTVRNTWHTGRGWRVVFTDCFEVEYQSGTQLLALAPAAPDGGEETAPDTAASIAPEDLYRHFKVLHKPTGKVFWVLGGDTRYESTGPGFWDYRAAPDGNGVLLQSAVESHPWGWVVGLTDLAPAPDGTGTYHPDHLEGMMALQLANSYEGSWRAAGRGETGSEEETTEQDAGVPPWRILHRTPSGRLAYIVYEGPDGGPRSEYRPVQGNGGTVRVRYVADAAQPADSYDSYGWEDPKTMAVEPDASGSWRKYADRLAAGEIEPDSDGETVTAVTGTYVLHNDRRLAIVFAPDRRDLLHALVDDELAYEIPGGLAELISDATLDALRTHVDNLPTPAAAAVAVPSGWSTL